MNMRTIATLAVAVALGLIAVVLLNGYLGASHKPSEIAAGGGVPVVVSALPIPRGAALQPAFLKVATYPSASVPIGAFTTIGDVVGPAGVQRFALRDMTPGEPILPAAVSGLGGRLTLSSTLAAGMEAVAVRSSDVAGVGGFVLPGDRVDVLLTRSIGQGNDQQNSVAQIIAENVRVMGVDQSDNDQADKPAVARSVTVEVSPAQAQAIALGQSVGQVSLALRHVSDSAVLARRATTVSDLGTFRVSPTPVSAPARAAPPADDKDGAVPLYGPGIVRVTRVTETTGYRLGGR